MGLAAYVVLPLYRTVRNYLEARGCVLKAVDRGVRMAIGSAAPVAVRCVRVCAPEPSGMTRSDPGWRRLARCTRLIQCDEAFDRPGIYGVEGVDYPDNAWRFAILCRAAVDMVRSMGRSLHARRVVLHMHDWHAALAALYLHASSEEDVELPHVARVVTVHNASFQGVLPSEAITQLGLPQHLYDWRVAEWHGRVNLMKGALAVADQVTTVSHTHATELRTALGGFGLHEAFAALGERLVGIRNGIDLDAWNPEMPVENTSQEQPHSVILRSVGKAMLQARCGLEVRGELPLIAVCSRLCRQKGIDLLLDARVGARLDLQIVVLGEGDRDLAEALHALAGQHMGRVAFVTPFTDEAERALLAGADMLLMPSRFEPCGLAQLRAQRFGVVPVAHRVGGLADTIRDGDTGFLFSPYGSDELHAALDRAIAAYASPAAWGKLVRACVSADVGWEKPATAYERVYEKALATRLASS